MALGKLKKKRQPDIVGLLTDVHTTTEGFLLPTPK